MGNPKPPSKMFLDIVEELKSLIKEEGIQTGGKIPSERELSERLQAGRSTIREALRSLELLGLIETRRGEGTFLADFRKHQLVEVLAAFIMQQPESVLDVQNTRRMHETAAISAVCASDASRALPVWASLLMKIETEGAILREDIIREMVVASDNRLSLKIWFLLKQYSRVRFDEMTSVQENQVVKKLLTNLLIGDEVTTLEAYFEWIELVEGERGERIE
ncbi:GntR family transcriptional regulator [Filibacter tadaridae]|uniref:HTH-type transcriptional regulator LutR n=1 Tax=Filibacter tadaridae TaxID=2483811 RepID=A0A3P5XE36_9BACL|nr:GntR family transcriptional regulator [Filibacter tadaridae]VDC26759.1 HTH-type transcriptional regulator LutR [Filibacter tadaridae]